jgi:hypothetical protein
MKPPARRIAIGAAVTGAVLVGLLGVSCRETVRDHIEAWRFQLARRTETVHPSALVRTASLLSPLVEARRPGSAPSSLWEGHVPLLQVAANELHGPVIFDPEDAPASTPGETRRTVCNIRGVLARGGWRLIEQRLPRRAYVLIRADGGARTP